MLLNHPFPPTSQADSLKESAHDPGWYVLRYRVLTQWLKNALKTSPQEIFHPYRHVKTTGKKTSEIHERPVLSGYVFVHAPLKEVKAMGQQLGLPIMFNPFWEDTIKQAGQTAQKESRVAVVDESHKYVHISADEMKPFMKAAELKAYDMTLFDPENIDVEKDDLVEFVSGTMKGVRGYLKAGKGRNGGLVIVPISIGNNEKRPAKHKHKIQEQATLAYSLKAHQNDLAVIAFAPKNRHAKDTVLDMKPVVNEAFEKFSLLGSVDSNVKERLIAYVRRYGQTQLNTSIQAAQHATLLYRINVILGHHAICQDLRTIIATEIVPALEQRKEAALKRGNADAATKHQELLDELEATDRLFLAHGRKLM